MTSRHPSGKKLMDLCDIVIDNCAPHGDAAVTIGGFPRSGGPLSSVTGCAIVNAIVAETVRMLVEKASTRRVITPISTRAMRIMPACWKRTGIEYATWG